MLTTLVRVDFFLIAGLLTSPLALFISCALSPHLLLCCYWGVILFRLRLRHVALCLINNFNYRSFAHSALCVLQFVMVYILCRLNKTSVEKSQPPSRSESVVWMAIISIESYISINSHTISCCVGKNTKFSFHTLKYCK